MVGKQISHYKIVSKLGEGGMGVVYRAEDTRLGRQVALKFLPGELGADPAGRERFMREARTASILNHKNVCTVYDIGEAEGVQFIAMELVEGITLRQRLLAGGLTAADALAYANQIAEALDAAHSKGVVHRDIKPENIMVDARDQIKVMDFGLARLQGSERLTRAQGAPGTVSYMSPEQIQGGETDGRSDIFSFGILLYEMFYGKAPFRGEHEAAIIYSIMHQDPDQQEAGASAPPALEKVIMKMLAKQPAGRYQEMAGVLADLREISGVQIEGTETGGRKLNKQPDVRVQEKTPLSPVLKAALLVIFIFAALWLYRMVSSRDTSNQIFNLRSVGLRGSSEKPAISPDGRYVAFVSRRSGAFDIYVSEIPEGRPKLLAAGLPGVDYLKWSADAGRILFSRAGCMFEIPLLGGIPQKAGDCAVDSWPSPDGAFTASIVQRPAGGVKIRSNADKSERLVFDANADPRSSSPYPFPPGYIAWSPAGDQIAIMAANGMMFGDGRLVRGPFWLACVSLNKRGVRFLAGPEAARNLSFSEFYGDMCWGKDDYIYFSLNRESRRSIWRISSEGGEARQVTSGIEDTYDPDLSTDGNLFAYTVRLKSSNLWNLELSTGNITQLTFERYASSPSFSPKSGRLVYVSYLQAPRQSELISYDQATGQSDLLVRKQGYLSSPSWSGDEKCLIARLENPDTAISSRKKQSFELVVLENTGNSLTIPVGIQGPLWSMSGKIYVIKESRRSILGLNADGQMSLYSCLGVIDSGDFRQNLADPVKLGSLIKEISPPEVKIEAFDIQPRAEKAVFQSVGEEGPRLGLLELRTGRVRDLIPRAKFPRWDPSGKLITFCRQDAQRQLWDLWQVDPDGKHEKRLAAVGSESAFLHAWKPDGTAIVFSKTEEKTDIALIENFKAYLRSKGG